MLQIVINQQTFNFTIPFGMMVFCDDTPEMSFTRVAKTGGDYDTIQAAVDASTDADIIIIEPGTYVEHVKMTKPLTLKAGASGVIIEGSMHIQTKNVRIDGLKIVPKSGHSIPNYTTQVGIYIDDVSDVSLDNIHVNGGDSSSLGYKRGIAAMAGAKFTVANSMIQNLYTGIFVNLNPSDTERVSVSVGNNTFTNNVVGIGGTENSNIEISNNTFESLGLTKKQAEGIGLGSGVLSAEGTEVDEEALETSNIFNYSTGITVFDHRKM